MKKITENFSRIFFVIVLLFSTINIFAANIGPTVKVLHAKEKTFVLVVDNNHQTELTIRIMDAQNEVLLIDKISSNNAFTKPYKLGLLPDGIYEVEIEGELFIQKQLVKLSVKGLEILEKEERRIFKPYVKSEGRVIIFNFLSAGNDEVDIAIFDSKGEEIFSKIYVDQKTIHQYFDLSKFTFGKYTVRVKTDQKVFRNVVMLEKS